MDNKIINWNIKQELENSFLDYALSVIVSRALPDVRDGLKPVHRRIIWSMFKEGNVFSSPYRKSARTVGDVIGHYHPHGDAAIYDSMVRMAQDFSLRHVLIKGQGNFGSIDGDSAAAMRYTEAKLAKISNELVEDIRKDTIDFVENYDGNNQEPSVLPSKFPNILVNGSEGIAVGMATSIPTHNLSETLNAVKAMIENPEIEINELCEIIKAPDFPTGAYILGRKNILQAYKTGKGSVRIRSKAEISSDLSKIIIKEIPYQVNKSKLIEKIAEIASNKEEEILSRIRVIRDESDRDGIRVVIELKKDANADLILSHLFKRTNLEVNHSINMVALVNGVPKQLNLKEILESYIIHQKEIITRRTIFDLNKAEKREHLLVGFLKAMDIIDLIVKTIRSSKNKEDAQLNLIKEFSFSKIQAQSIVEMQLYRLTGLEKDKLQKEYDEVIELIKELKSILEDENKLESIIIEKLDEINLKYGEDRKSEILEYVEDDMDEDLIPKDDLFLTITKNGYVKTTKESEFSIQSRAGKGSNGLKIYEDDEVEIARTVHSHSNLLFFSNKNKVYRTKAYNIGVTSKASRGTSIVNLFKLEKDEDIKQIIEMKENIDKSSYLVFITKKGIIKKSKLEDFTRINKNGKKYTSLVDDEVISVFVAKDDNFVQIATNANKAITFSLSQLKVIGRTAKGVKGIKLKENQEVVSATQLDLEGMILTITNNGYGKLTKITDIKVDKNGKEINKGFTPKKRGGQGLLNSKLNDKAGKVVFNTYVSYETYKNDNLILITNKGKTIKIKLSDLSISSRTSMGTTIQKLNDGELISSADISSYGESISEE